MPGHYGKKPADKKKPKMMRGGMAKKKAKKK